MGVNVFSIYVKDEILFVYDAVDVKRNTQISELKFLSSYYSLVGDLISISSESMTDSWTYTYERIKVSTCYFILLSKLACNLFACGVTTIGGYFYIFIEIFLINFLIAIFLLSKMLWL